MGNIPKTVISISFYFPYFRGLWWPSGKVPAFATGGLPDLKPDSIAEPWCILPPAYAGSQTSSPWCSVEAWRGELLLRFRRRHLPAVQSYEVHPKIVLVFLQNGTLI
ncbi:hypothetical protein AVEN_205065-1 [Araneus ventricosus]|uniref:Uncharacterized protein n=1 Tax=Araneus ventricosus TaxID=182803 RepID=A0A4Y2ISW7_ARAVE|nr:hypothetical protein AVEN_205065-1 [Araneus ventricosus]